MSPRSVFSFVIGVGIGVLSAVKRGSWFDYSATGAAFFGLSMPNFWFAIMLQLFFGVYLVDWLGLDGPFFFTAGTRSPGTTGFDLLDRVRHLVLPALVLAVQLVAVYSRYMRASLLEVLNADYVRTARAKGASEGRVVGRHAMRNAMIPVTTQLAGDVGALFGGLVITETVFQWPGMGPLFLTAMQNGDYQVILPVVDDHGVRGGVLQSRRRSRVRRARPTDPPCLNRRPNAPTTSGGCAAGRSAQRHAPGTRSRPKPPPDCTSSTNHRSRSGDSPPSASVTTESQ